MTQLITLEYDGMPVDFTGAAWFNATEVADRFGKRVDNWLRLAETKEYMTELAGVLNPSHQRELNTRNPGDLIRTRRGAKGGTWMHPKLGVAFARWLDVRFAIWCDMQIDQILRGGLADWRRSSVGERVPMYVAALEASPVRHVSWSHVVGWGNRLVGVKRARLMTVEQTREARNFFERLKEWKETPDDLRRIETNSIALHGDSKQMPLLGMGVGK
ncbi:KilA-N domain-containing protein [Bordetella bronchiseptica]|nr:KilA-N domain-containing protein [Bordetella bronchiseptica]